MTDIKDLKIKDFKHSPTKTYDAERSDQPLQTACDIESCEKQGQAFFLSLIFTIKKI